MLKMLVVDDEYLVRLGIVETIDWSQYNVQIVAQAEDGEQGLALALLHKPDVIITDVRMPHMNGLELIAKLKENELDAGIIVLSGYDEFHYVQMALQYGASSYLLKPINIEHLSQSVIEIGKVVLQKRNQRNRLNLLNQEIQTISKQFWIDMLLGNNIDENITQDKLQLIQLDVQTVFPLTIVSLQCGEQDSFQTNIEQHSLQAIINQLADKHHLILVNHFLINHDHLYIVLSLSKFQTHPLENVYSFSVALIDEVSQINGVRAGIGMLAENWKQIAMSYKTAKKAAYASMSSLTPVHIAEHEPAAFHRREIKAALDYIRTHYAENVTAEKVAAAVYISPTHLMHLFRKELNKTFTECLTEYRIEVAKKMLKNPKYRVYEVGVLVGFSDSKYFSQVFKKVTGVSPSEYTKL